MKIEAGKRYVMRNGDVSPIVNTIASPRAREYVFEAQISDMRVSWTTEGKVLHFDSPTCHDLIYEYDESPQPVPPTTYTLPRGATVDSVLWGGKKYGNGWIGSETVKDVRDKYLEYRRYYERYHNLVKRGVIKEGGAE